jgi:CBS-domain-containing membrane protein
MTLCARDVMVTAFDKIDENASIEKAIQMISNGKVRKTGHKTISLMVTDDYGNLVGVITMYDILYHLRPAFLNHGIDGDQLPWIGQLDNFIRDLKGKKVKQVMSTHGAAGPHDKKQIPPAAGVGEQQAHRRGICIRYLQ